MSQAPSMPMYWDAYLADTTHLTTEEHGAYMLLLGAMWRRNGSVPDDDKDNARILGLSTAKWRKIKARFQATISGFHIKNGVITQEKLQKTWKNTQEKINKNRSNGSKGGRAAASKNNDLDQANATNSRERKASIPEPEPEPIKDFPLSARGATETNQSREKIPEDAFEKFWAVYPNQVQERFARQQFDFSLIRAGSLQTIIDGVYRYVEDVKRNPRPYMNPQKWLDGDCWNDKYAQPPPKPKQKNNQRLDAAQRALERHRENEQHDFQTVPTGNIVHALFDGTTGKH